MVGPLDNIDTSLRLRERLRNIAAAGPSNRVGLFPDPSSRHWRFDPSAGPDSVAVIDHPTVDVGDPGSTVTNFAVAPGYQAPLHIYLADPWLLIDFDHGLGGGKLMTELIAAVTSDVPAFAEPQPKTDCHSPVLRAFAHTARVAPRELIRAFDLERAPNQPASSGSFDESAVVVYAHSDAGFLAELRARRDREMSGASVLATITAAMLGALNSVGITTESAVGIMVDLSRYLPEGTGTLSNFLGIAPISTSRPFDARDIGDQIDRYTNGYRSLVRYGLATMVNMRKPTAKSVVKQCDNGRARLVVTDHGETSAARKIRWAGPEGGRVFVRHAPVGYSNQITLAVNRVGHQLHLSASFYAWQFDRDSVNAALRRVVAGSDIANS